MMVKNMEFVKYVDKKILKRLVVFAKFKKDASEEDRGSSIFGTPEEPQFQS